MSRVVLALVLVSAPLGSGVALASSSDHGEIVLRDVNSGGRGVTVLRVCGTDHEMGFAQGELLADDIVTALTELQADPLYSPTRAAAAQTGWADPRLEQEMAGVAAGVLSAQPAANIDALDVKVINGMGDWPYACRTTCGWGTSKPPAAPWLTTPSEP